MALRTSGKAAVVLTFAAACWLGLTTSGSLANDPDPNLGGQREPLNFGAWTLLCGPTTCRLVQVQRNLQGAISASLRISNLTSDQQASASVLLPEGVHFPSGSFLWFDQAKFLKLTFVECKARLCRADAAVDAAALDWFQTYPAVGVVYRPKLDTQISQLRFSLDGFSEAYAHALQEQGAS